MRKNVLLAAVLFTINVSLTLLLYFVIGNLLDTDVEFAQKAWVWQKTGDYPFPTWLVLLVPRITIWPWYVEVSCEIAQAAIWSINGFFLKRYLPDGLAIRWIWMPIVMHIYFWDPVQVFLGSLAFYFMTKGKDELRGRSENSRGGNQV